VDGTGAVTAAVDGVGAPPSLSYADAEQASAARRTSAFI
jgi:hypothetical protein